MKKKADIEALKQRARALRKHVLAIATAQPAHVGGSMSCADLMAALFFHYLRLGDGQPRDRFLLSKGHAVHIYHACLVELGLIEARELPRTMQLGSRLAGHPTRRAPGVEHATGSLGHALAVGVGIALAEQLNRSVSRTVVMLGDGELQEGTVWEAALIAPRFGLKNLVAIVDYNRFQASGSVDEILPLEPLAAKWRAFGWNTHEIDGHDMPAIVAVLDKASSSPYEGGLTHSPPYEGGAGGGFRPHPSQAPTVLIAHTVKGKGVPAVEGTPRAHFTRLTEEEAHQALKSL